MTKLEFLKGMKKLANYFLKDLSDEELTSWYEIFKDIEVETFYMSIQEIGKSNKFKFFCFVFQQIFSLKNPMRIA